MTEDAVLPELVKIDINRCARCHEDHAGLEFRSFSIAQVLEDDELFASHWASCPTNGEPVLMRILMNVP